MEGCCICRTKSSSSRFTDSSKYEDTFRGCFNLGDDRVGEICNACVLLVKRWKKLPKNTKRNWSHVVDARAGPGAKNFVKQKKKDEAGEEFEKIRRKHSNKKPSRTNSGEPGEEECLVTPENVEIPSSRLRENKIGDFFDSYYWKRESVRGRDIYRGLMGEIMIDTRSWVSEAKDEPEKVESAAENDDNNNDKANLSDAVPMTVESLIESELRKLSGKKTGETCETDLVPESRDGEVVKVGLSVGEQDEGFCDKSSTLTGPTSPLSDSVLVCPDLGLEDE